MPSTTARTTRATPPTFPVTDAVLKRIVAPAAMAGLLSGLLLTALQQVQVAPLIRKAELLEAGSHVAPSLAVTAVANVSLAVGFALLLCAVISMRGRTGWRAGLLWGLAGYLVFFVAPSLALPPQLPGPASGMLRDRQLWWIATVACSAGGLWLAVFARHGAMRLLGLALIVAPHLVVAPQPLVAGASPVAQMARDFVRATYLANGIFWLALGALVGLFFKRER
jgi:predicted cobalt transporter CbtA